MSSTIRGVQGLLRVPALAGTLLAPLGALLWSGPGLAAQACLAGAAPNKVCLTLDSIPVESVQPSRLADGQPTYVQYKAVLSNTALATSRFVELDFDLAPASGFVSVVADAGMRCTFSGSHVDCLVDKLDRIEPLNVTLVAEAPRHPTTATQLLNTAVFGFQGNTATTSKSVAVSGTSGRTFIPAGQTAVLVTEPETADPSQQVSEGSPTFGKVFLPAQPVDTYARIGIVSNGPLNSNCQTGVFFTVFDGGPYLCRDTGRRWTEFDVGVTEGAQPPALYAAANPMQFTLIYDASTIAEAQLPPSAAAPTGTPAFAVFYAQPENNPYPDSVAARAFAERCSDTGNVPPCINSVTRLGSGDWAVTGLKVNDGTDIPTPLDQLQDVLASLLMIGSADAKGVLPPIM